MYVWLQSQNKKKEKISYSSTDEIRQCTHCGIIILRDSSENKRHCTLDKKCSRDATTVTRAGSSPISSFDSLNAVATSSASPSSAFPPGSETSPGIPYGGNKIIIKCIEVVNTNLTKNSNTTFFTFL